MTDVPALLERAWGVLSRWAVPVMMTLAYALLVATSEANRTGEAWMAAGLVLVMTAWVVFRRLTAAAALSRALSVGDTAALLAIADRELARRRRPAARAPYLVARAFARLLRGEHAAALETLGGLGDLAQLPVALRPLCLAIDGLAAIEQADATRIAAARTVGARPGPPWLRSLVEGVLAWHDGRLDMAAQLIGRVRDDIRAGSALHAIAYVYLARISDAGGDTATAARHRASAAALAAPDAAWLRGAIRPAVANS